MAAATPRRALPVDSTASPSRGEPVPAAPHPPPPMGQREHWGRWGVGEGGDWDRIRAQGGGSLRAASGRPGVCVCREAAHAVPRSAPRQRASAGGSAGGTHSVTARARRRRLCRRMAEARTRAQRLPRDSACDVRPCLNCVAPNLASRPRPAEGPSMGRMTRHLATLRS